MPLTGRVKQVDDGVPDVPASDVDFLLAQRLFSDPHLYSAQIRLDIPDPLVGPVVFEVWREGLVVNHQEFRPKLNGQVIAAY